MRLYRVRVGPDPMSGVLTRRGNFGQRDRIQGENINPQKGAPVYGTLFWKPQFMVLCFGSPRKLIKHDQYSIVCNSKRRKTPKYPLVRDLSLK